MATPIKYSQLQQVVSYISLGESASKLSHKLVLGDENSWSSDGFGLSLVNDTLEIIVPMYRAEMFMQIGFTDGSTSAVSPVKTVGMAQGNSVILLDPRQAGAPDLLLSFSSNLNQASLIVPHVDADADVQYSFYAGVNDALQANGHMCAKTGLALNNVTSVGIIGLVVVHNGQSSRYEYINPIANAVADLELENAKNQVKTMFGCGQTHCSFGWLNSTQVDIDRVADIFVGLTGTELVSVSDGDFSSLNQVVNALRLQKLAEEQQRIANEPEQSGSLGFGTPVNVDRGVPLVERLADQQVFKTSDDWRTIENKREAVIITYTFPPERLFFNVEWIDGISSNVFVHQIN